MIPIMNAVEIFKLINTYVSITKIAISGANGVLVMVVALVLTANKLADLLTSKKKLFVDSPPGTVSYT
jgi:hypothetical protein